MLDLSKMKGLVVGVANENSIAWGCAQAFQKAAAELAITYMNDKSKTYVEPLANKLETSIFCPLDVTNPLHFQTLFDEIRVKWGRLDFILHSIAFAPKDDLHGRVIDCSAEGFLMAMDVSCHSLIRLAKMAEPLMKERGGSILTMSYYGSQKVVENYNLMGPVKAALEATVRSLAFELGSQNIRVNAISSGPIMTRAASGLAGFEAMIAKARERSPIPSGLTIEHVGNMASFLVSPLGSSITGQTIYVDQGESIVG